MKRIKNFLGLLRLPFSLVAQKSQYYRLSTIYLLIVILVSVAGNGQEVISLYPGKAPGTLNDADKEVFSRPATGRPTVKNVTRPTLTVYIPVQQNASHSAVIICPGGGYLNLSIEDGGHEVAKDFAKSGVTAFVLKYRTWVDSAYSDFSVAPMLDLQQAMQIVYSNANRWNLDTSHVGVLGFSAGGHLTAMAATTENGRKPAFTLLIYPVISFTDALTSKTSKTRSTLLGRSPSPQQKRAFSPELHVTATTPPAFIVQAEDDSTSLVGNSLAYYQALVAHQIPAQLLVYQKGGHGFAMHNKAQDDYWMPAAIRWLGLNGFYQPEADKHTTSYEPPFWNDIIAFKKLDATQTPQANSILFVGSSSFAKWTDVQNYFPGFSILNRGFGGSVLTDVIRYAYDIIIPYHPKQVVIYCGENDLGSSVKPEEVVNRVKTLFGIIRQNLPLTTISYVSIKPSPIRNNIQDGVKEANRQIKSFLKAQKNADFIDIYDAMLNANGKMREELYQEDRLHMKPEGYVIWKKIMMPYMRH